LEQLKRFYVLKVHKKGSHVNLIPIPLKLLLSDHKSRIRELVSDLTPADVVEFAEYPLFISALSILDLNGLADVDVEQTDLKSDIEILKKDYARLKVDVPISQSLNS
jgi:hypothetical protein